MLKPMGSRIVIQPDSTETKSSSGLLFIPEEFVVKPQTGRVLAVGPGAVKEMDIHGRRPVCPVAVGDHIMYEKGAGFSLNFEGQDVRIINFDEVLGRTGE